MMLYLVYEAEYGDNGEEHWKPLKVFKNEVQAREFVHDQWKPYNFMIEAIQGEGF
jgi:hypothetical protein